MLGNPPYYFHTLRRMVIIFGTVFNDIIIHRTASNGAINQVIRVPLTYAPKNKLLVKADIDNDSQKPIAMTLPHMAFEMMTDISYDGGRKLPGLNKFVIKDNDAPNKLKRQYVGVPYQIPFNLYVYANHIEDGNKIIEQILPMFTPDWTVETEIIPEMGIKLDIPITLQGGIQLEDKFDGKFTDRRILIWTLPFMMKTMFYGPIKSKPIIKFANENFYFESPIANNSPEGVLAVRPGLDANGAPTSDANVSVDANTIFIDDDYGYVETFSSGPIQFE